MIISDIKHNLTIIRGKGIEILQEYIAINCNILYAEPEMFVAVQSLLAEEAMELFPQLDSDKVSAMMKDVREFIQENKKAGTWND